MTNDLQHPAEFLTVRVHTLEPSIGLTGLCAGYEAGEWRCAQLANHLLEWLPEFALNHSEREGICSHNAVALIAQAAKTVYTSEKYQKRGEIGELLLHIGIRQVFKTIPVISKYFYKDSGNDTVKGFDAVHVIASDETLELWLGEVKFYKDINSAIKDVVKELAAHTKRDYLRSEFAAITNKIDDSWPYAKKLGKLLHKSTSLDEVFDSLCIPVFLTYESPTIASYAAVTKEFKEDFDQEVKHYHSTFLKQPLPTNIKIHLFLFPMKLKDALLQEFDKRLKACQTMAN